jgi:transcription-repair coupling factor (superfamily II helicase)
MPEAVQRLVAVVDIKILARRLALERVEQRRHEVCLAFHPQTPIQPDHLLQWLHSAGMAFRFPSEQTACMVMTAEAPEARLGQLKKLLQQLLAGVSMSTAHS